jgi:hypothetical protein
VAKAEPAVPVPAPAPAPDKGDADQDRGRRRRRGGRGRGRGGEERAAEAPAIPPREDHALTLAEAFHLLTRALGELPTPAAHEVLRARMAALHGREDALLESTTFLRLLRQANDAEVADVRLVAEGEFEVSPHKSDLAMQVRPMVELNGGAAATPNQPARPPAALRYRSGMQAAKRGGQVPMVGVVQIEGEVTPEATATTPEAAAEKPGSTPAKKSSRRGVKTKAAAKTPKSTAKPEAKPDTKPDAKTTAGKPARSAKASTRSRKSAGKGSAP